MLCLCTLVTLVVDVILEKEEKEEDSPSLMSMMTSLPLLSYWNVSMHPPIHHHHHYQYLPHHYNDIQDLQSAYHQCLFTCLLTSTANPPCRIHMIQVPW